MTLGALKRISFLREKEPQVPKLFPLSVVTGRCERCQLKACASTGFYLNIQEHTVCSQVPVLSSVVFLSSLVAVVHWSRAMQCSSCLPIGADDLLGSEGAASAKDSCAEDWYLLSHSLP